MKETTKRDFIMLLDLAPGRIANGLSLIHWENMTDKDIHELIVALNSCSQVVTDMMIRSLSKHNDSD